MSGFKRKVERANRKQAMMMASSALRSDKKGKLKKGQKMSDFMTVPKAMVPGAARARRRALATEMRKKSGRNK